MNTEELSIYFRSFLTSISSILVFNIQVSDIFLSIPHIFLNITNYFILFDAIVNEKVSFILFLDYSLLLNRNVINFYIFICVLQFWSDWVINSKRIFFSFLFFLCGFLVISIYNIMSSGIKTVLFLSF